MKTRYYYVDKDNSVHGPVPLSDIVEMVKQGALEDSIKLCAEGTEDWQPFAEYLPKAQARKEGGALGGISNFLNRFCNKEYRFNTSIARLTLIAVACITGFFLLFIFSPLLMLSVAVAILVLGTLALRSYKSAHSSRTILHYSAAAIGVGGFVLNCMGMLIFIGLLDSLSSPAPSDSRSSDYASPSYLPSLEEMRNRHEIARELFFLQHGDTIEAADRWARESAKFAEELERAKKR